MPARNKARVHLMALGLVLVLFTGLPRIEAGKCIGGDRARVVRLFERLYFLVTDKLAAGEFHLRDFLTELRGSAVRLIPILSMNMIRLESRWSLRRLLIDDEISVVKMSEALQAHADRAQHILITTTREFTKMPPGEFKRIAAMTAGTFLVCKAVRQKSPEACAALDSPDQDELRWECESLAVRVGILYQNDCSDEAVGKMASAWHKQADVTRAYCRAIKEKQPHQCNVPDTSPLEQAACRSLAGHGEIACQDPVFSKAATRECQNELRIQAVLAGSIPPSAIPKELKEQELVWPALLAARGDIPCDELAIDAYEKMMAPLALFTHLF